MPPAVPEGQSVWCLDHAKFVNNFLLGEEDTTIGWYINDEGVSLAKIQVD